MSDSIEGNQMYTTICSSSVLVMHRPDIRQEPERKMKGNERLWGYLTKKHLFSHSYCNSSSIWNEWELQHLPQMTTHTKHNQDLPFQQITRMPASTKWQIYSKLIIQRLGLEHFSRVEQIHWRRCLQIRHGHMCELNTALEHTEDNVGQRQLVSSPRLSHILT